MNTTYTEDLGDIMSCARERNLVAKLLNTWNAKGLPDTFSSEGARFAFNRNSGNVFLVNDEYQCAMMNGDELQVFHSTPYEGKEGFLCDLLNEYAPEDLNADDAEYIRDAARGEGVELPAAWQDNQTEEA